MALKLNETNFDEVVLKSEKPVLVDFWATWCGPCRMLAPVLDEVAEEQADKIVYAKVDVDEAPGLARRYGIMSIPTLIVFKGGEAVQKSIGVIGKEDIEDMLV